MKAAANKIGTSKKRFFQAAAASVPKTGLHTLTISEMLVMA